MAARQTKKKWSGKVTQTSDALDLKDGVFARGNAEAVAKSLLASARRSRRRKSTPVRSAMSMLTFYINRAGRQLSARRRATLERAKDVLRALTASKSASPARPRAPRARATARRSPSAKA